MKEKTVSFNGELLHLTWNDKGYWTDDQGTIWPDIWEDPGYCGLAPAETGKWDPFWKPACKPHDAAFNALKAGNPNVSGLETFGNFTGSVIETMAQGAYAVVTGPLYILIGGVGGLFRWLYLEDKNDEQK